MPIHVDKNKCSVCGTVTMHYVYVFGWRDDTDLSKSSDTIDSSCVYLECNKCGSIIKRHTDYYDKSSRIWQDEWVGSAWASRPKIIAKTNHIKVNEYIRPKSKHEKQKGRFR